MLQPEFSRRSLFGTLLTFLAAWPGLRNPAAAAGSTASVEAPPRLTSFPRMPSQTGPSIRLSMPPESGDSTLLFSWNVSDTNHLSSVVNPSKSEG
jgi:hypothetical protein